MKVTAPTDFGFVVAHGGPVAKGQEIEVDAEDGARLVEQGWTSAVAKAARKTARKRKAAAKAEADEPTTPEPAKSEAVPEPEPEADAEADPKENA